jgi:hypothetical protein
MADKLLQTLKHTVNRHANGGEALTIETDIFDNGDGEAFVNQRIILMSYENKVTLELAGAVLDSEFLYRMADDIGDAMDSVSPKKEN